jgi:hypothetical protein
MNEEQTDAIVDAILAGAKPAEESVPICMRADVLSEIGELERQINIVSSDDDDPRMVSEHENTAAELADQIRALEAVAHANTINLRLKAVPKDRWREVVDKHKSEDEDTGVEQTNLTAVCEELFEESIVSPKMSGTRLETFQSTISDAQSESIMKSMWRLNRTITTVGKSVTASQVFMRQSAKPGHDGQ